MSRILSYVFFLQILNFQTTLFTTTIMINLLELFVTEGTHNMYSVALHSTVH